MTNEELIQEWLDSLKLENKSDMTINEYKKCILLMLEMPFFKGKHLLDLNREYISLFRLHRADVDAVSARTLNKNLSGIKNFLSYCLRRKYILENFFTDIQVKYKNNSLPRPIAVDTLNEILDNKAPLNPKYNNQKLRDLAAAEIAYSGGLRISELHAIKLSDISLSTLQLKVLGKGNRERIVFLGKKALEALSTWLLIRNKWISKAGVEDCGYLFIAPSGKHIAKNHLGACMTALLRAHGSGNIGSTHALRHSFASHMYNKTKDIRSVQEMLGHKSLTSTQVYILVDHETLIESYKDAHPRARANQD
ncbi:tyrosine-type recombinase/integrase [Acinetobacter baumannii]|jgi:integrase/recombinase XerC|nr:MULTISPECIES: tyrosine-type recombinase/integrase [Acinetobacter]MCF1257014.1 tyrosine-type recombinase/integrase [Acinetobacter baumannii]MCF1283037.1 tyrosine-type recombinase/integrase [Acinetobacter pittii]MCF1297750.1 tyrosine-type recombinase/integrase [Acinetobacter nosocomialis]